MVVKERVKNKILTNISNAIVNGRNQNEDWYSSLIGDYSPDYEKDKEVNEDLEYNLHNYVEVMEYCIEQGYTEYLGLPSLMNNFERYIAIELIQTSEELQELINNEIIIFNNKEKNILS